ncbi:MAG: hypothetical protein WC563_13530 [Brevundimonas sp.]
MARIVYTQVNEALNEILLGGRFSGRPLYVALDKQGREELARRLDLPEDAVEATCCKVVGRSLLPTGNPYWRHSNDLATWTRMGRPGLPPFTALLFTLSHAAGQMASDDEFSQTNYYQRLAEVTGHAPGHLSFHGRGTEEFWRAFSEWLAATNYAHGRPTARQLPSQKYVSLAVSQAIVRASDREDFHALFEKYGFTGADVVSAEEMARYIASWIHGPAANKRLKAAWSQAELRPRIAEVALAELEAWASRDAGAPRPGAGGVGARLSLAASIGGFPSRRLSLSLGRKSEGEGAIALSAGEGSPALELGNATYGGFATLSPASAVDLPGVLRRGISLAAPGGGSRLEWRPRFVIPFAKSASGPFWAEASQGMVGVEHMVLVLDTQRTRDAVDAVLAEVAIPGFTRATPAQLPGLPQGWLLYQGVQLMRAAGNPPDAAADLSPMAEAGGLRIEGGMRLAPGVWHRHAPPAIRFDGAPAGASLELRDGIDEQGNVVEVAGAMNGWALLDLAKLELPASGDLFARGLVGRGRDHAVSLLVRSARRPQPLDRQGRSQLLADSLDGAVEAPAADREAIHVTGLRVHGETPPLVAAEALASRRGIHAGEAEACAEDAGDEMLPDEPASPPAPRIAWTNAEEMRGIACGERGFHWYLVDPVPAGAPASTPVSMACEGCNHAFLRNGGAQPSGGATAQRRPTTPPPPPPAPAPPAEGRVDLDLLLDALSFMGSGSWGAFEALVAGELDQPWEAAAIARDLASLGHLDLRRQAGSGRILAWSVPPPMLAMRPGDVGFLAGFRNAGMIEEAARRIGLAGGTLAVTPRPAQPALVEVSGIPAADVAAAISGLVDPHEREVRVELDAAGRLASACLAMGQAWSLATPASLGRDKDMHIYDLATHGWRPVGGPSGAGAYRTRSNGATYIFVDAEGQARQAPHELAKLMAARAAGKPLHAFQPGDAVFTSVLGCEPPGLLGRALVACSGMLPLRSPGRLHHPGVPPAVAATVLEVLYPEPKP